VERKIVFFGFINGNFTLPGIYIEILDAINLGIGEFIRGKGLYEHSLILAIVKFGIHETGSDVPHKMAKWHTDNLLELSSPNEFGDIFGIVYPFMNLEQISKATGFVP